MKNIIRSFLKLVLILAYLLSFTSIPERSNLFFAEVSALNLAIRSLATLFFVEQKMSGKGEGL